MKNLFIILLLLTYTTIYTTALPITPSAQLLDISKIVKRSDAPDSTVALEKNVLEKRDPINFTSFNPSRDDIR
ncbi:hypothetical protein C2G38_2163239 [Gigaspora rosea]|uniref:Uncharacterized protein n=1 Tax=Gigaspora rosea TaxID=44941 RepID=A0A397VXI7_9GLOM|nr:hypothetical protein C2G38_2163239 [Gigaspora rosea]